MPSSEVTSRDLVVVTPVWGERHIRRFLDLVLPSWLAPGNLPALAAQGKVPLVLLTRERDVPLIARSEPFRRALAFVEPEFIAMDDLIGPNGVPVTLTLAYARGIARNVSAESPRPFALLNADFLLADGSLRSLGEALDAGAQTILAPSLRVIEEEVLSDFLLEVKDGAFVLPPRELVGRAIRALHPTALSSRVDQTAISSANPNQLFWRPNADLMIGRAFCMFTLAAVVRGPAGPVGSYCDYGFTEDLGVRAEPVIFGDSDRFLAVELAPLRQEQQFFRYQTPSPARVAEALSKWTTREHRDQARHVLMYKAADPPADLAGVVGSSDRFLNEVTCRFGPPQPRLEHPHWLGGVAAWRLAREYRGVAVDPPELASTVDIRVRPAGSVLTPARSVARMLLVGEAGRRSLQHPYWRLEKALKRHLRATVAGSLCILGSSDSTGMLDEAFAGASDPAEADGVVAYVDTTSDEGVDQLLAKLRTLGPGRPAILIVRRTAEDDMGPMAVADLLSALDTDFITETVEPLDLRYDRQVELSHGRLADLQAAGIRKLTALGLGSLIMSGTLLVRNALIGGGMRPPTRAITAALVICRRRIGHQLL